MTHTSVNELIIGTSAVARDLRETVRRAAPHSAPVLIQGPTGAGKELVAHGLHVESGRRGRFVTFNAAAIPESLFETEVLGHVRGAFSGAVRDRAGLLRSANHGTAFIDEIGELSPLAQAKMLRVLDAYEVSAVGSDVTEKVNFRLVTATNVNLLSAAGDGRFRTDLIFRLRGIVISVPALRDHPEDIAPLTAHFARMIADSSNTGEISFTPAALRRLEAYSWPGNVRELRQAIQHAAFLANGSTIGELHVKQVLAWGRDGAVELASQLENDRRKFLELLAAYEGNVNGVARALGVDRSTVYRRMQRLGLSGVPRGLSRVPVSAMEELCESDEHARVIRS